SYRSRPLCFLLSRVGNWGQLVPFVGAEVVWMWGWDACVARPIRRGGSGVDVGMGRLRRPGRRGKRSRDQDEGDGSIPTALACCSLPSKRTGRPEAPGISRTPLQILCPATRFYSYISSYPQTGSTGHSDVSYILRCF